MKVVRTNAISESFFQSLRKASENQTQVDTSKQPWQMTNKEFMQYHNTGSIPSSAYERYAKREGITWLGPKTKHPILHSKKIIDGKEIEFRQDEKKNRYVKHDETEGVLRDEKGEAVYYTDEEVISNGYPLYDETIVAFDEKGPIGWVSNEFGVPGVFVIEEYQRKGIGTYLLSAFMKNRPATQKIGQMTNSGWNMSVSYHKQLIREALEHGQPVPPEVLKDYPELAPKENNS